MKEGNETAIKIIGSKLDTQNWYDDYLHEEDRRYLYQKLQLKIPTPSHYDDLLLEDQNKVHLYHLQCIIIDWCDTKLVKLEGIGGTCNWERCKTLEAIRNNNHFTPKEYQNWLETRISDLIDTVGECNFAKVEIYRELEKELIKLENIK